jgi:protein-disulfide isomerase
MRKVILIVLIFTAVGLAGCLPQVQATPTAISTATSNARPAPTVVLSVPTESSFLPDSGCTVITNKPTPGPTAESIFPPVSDKDWVKGPASAKVTIIEYSDFQ